MTKEPVFSLSYSVENQDKIILLKAKNEEEQLEFSKEIEKLKYQLQEDMKNPKDNLSKLYVKTNEKAEAFDTQTIMKRRLKKLMTVGILM